MYCIWSIGYESKEKSTNKMAFYDKEEWRRREGYRAILYISYAPFSHMILLFFIFILKGIYIYTNIFAQHIKDKRVFYFKKYI